MLGGGQADVTTALVVDGRITDDVAARTSDSTAPSAKLVAFGGGGDRALSKDELFWHYGSESLTSWKLTR